MKRMYDSYKNTRKPMAHNSYWNENDQDNIVPEERAVLAGTVRMVNLQNYDTVINQKQAGYRNNGVFIYYNNGLHPLSRYPDDYGSLPEWVETHKEDCGYSYFSDYLIDHNNCVPFKTSDWKIGPSNTTEIKPFKFSYTYVNVKTQLTRTDGAECTLVVPVMISAPWLGGPIDDIRSDGSYSSSEENIEKYTYRNGKKLELKFTYDEDYNPVFTQPLNSPVIIPLSTLKEAEKLVNDSLKTYFKKEKYVYFDANGPCLFNEENLLYDEQMFQKVIQLTANTT